MRSRATWTKCVFLGPSLVGVALLLRTGAVAAQEQEPARFEYSASPGCPSSADFEQTVESRTSRVRPAREGEAARTFRVTLTQDHESGAATGTLVVLESGHPNAPRTVEARSCTEAFVAVAFMTALSVDPKAQPPPAPADEGAVPPPPASPPPGTPAVPSPPAIVALAAAPPSSARRPASVEAVAPRASGRSVWAVGAGFEALGFAAPSAVPAADVFVAWRWVSGAVFSPELRLRAFRTWTTEVELDATHTAFSWTFGRLEFSPVRLGSRLSIEGAPLVDAGVVSAGGGGTSRTFPHTRVWVAPGALLRGGFRFVGPIRLEAEVGGLIPIVREAFVYLPGPPAYTAPPVALFGGIDASVQFP